MVTTLTTAIDQDIRQTPLLAVLDPTTPVGLDGYYLKEGMPVRITGDKTIKPCLAGEAADGIAMESLYYTQVPGGATPTGTLDERVRVSWLPLRFGRLVLRATAGPGGLQAGNRVVYDPATLTLVAAQPLAAAVAAGTTVDAAALTGSIPAGETPVTSTGAQPTVAITGAVTAATTATATLTGTTLPTEEVGICWAGAIEGSTALIIV